MSIAGALSSGEDVELIAVDGERFELVSPRAFAPGAPIALTAKLDEALSLSGKSLGSKRLEDERFQVRGRFVNLRRTDRERLQEALQVPA